MYHSFHKNIKQRKLLITIYWVPIM